MPVTIVLAESCPVCSLANVFMAEDLPHVWRTSQTFVSIPSAPGGLLAAPSGGGSECSFLGASPPGLWTLCGPGTRLRWKMCVPLATSQAAV